MENRTRLAKRMAESGIASRREAEKLIESGRVTVDEVIVKTPVFFVTNQSKIAVDKKIISKKSDEIIVWKFHKPRGVITTKSDPSGRKTVFDFFPDDHRQRLVYVGRLDYNSEGLLLFTNNGDVARKLELPSNNLKRTYRVRILGNLTEEKIRKLKDGITIHKVKYRPVEIKMYNVGGCALNRANSWIVMTLSEGKNREIRKMMDYIGCTVNRLIRISYGPFSLGDLPSGKFLQIPKQETAKLLSWTL